MASEKVSVVLITQEHLLSGKIFTGGLRVLDFLNDQSTEFLRISDVHVCRRKGNTCVATLEELVLRKSKIGVVIPTSEKHEAPKKRFNSFVSKKQLDIFIIACGHEVRGSIHLQGGSDPISALGQELLSFFPVANGDVSSAGTFPSRRAMPVVIVNQVAISALSIGESGKTAPAASDRADEPASAAELPKSSEDMAADLLAKIAGLTSQAQDLKKAASGTSATQPASAPSHSGCD